MEFGAILQAHLARYPLMTPQDCGKLAYQSEFGPEHLAPALDYVTTMLEREWAEVLAGQAYIAPEDIGGGLVRFYLNPEKDIPAAAALLAQLFCRTAREHQGTQEGLEEKLAVLAQQDIPGMVDWLADYRAQGCPAVRHSEVYRHAYGPHYRLLRAEYARFWPALQQIWSLYRSGKPAIVAIDGRCASGKTTLAKLAAELMPCNVLHMDDYYKPIAQRAPDWETTPGGNIDYPRLQVEVFDAIAAGKAITCRVFDCGTQTLQAAQTLPQRPLTILEGSYCQHPTLREGYALKIFVTCRREEQLRRLRAREGEGIEGYLSRWVPMEDRYHAACQVEEHADILIDTAKPW